MRIFLIVGAMALFAACTPPPQGGADTAHLGGCEAIAMAPWRPLSGVEFSTSAVTTGPSCEQAVATIIIRDATGRALWAEAAPTEHIMVLAPARDQPAMQAALNDWLNQESNTTLRTTSALPEWPANADGPQSGEFPFYVEPSYDRAAYNEARAANTPMFCYVQGMESMACLTTRNGGLEKIGVQAFPG